MNSTQAGWHLILDAHVEPGKADLLKSGDFIKQVILGLVKLLGMKVLAGPEVHEVPVDRSKLWSEEDEGGITAMCVITTSHISIHTWPVRHRFSMDIFSCKPFDKDAAEDYIKAQFHVTSRWRHDINRIWPSGAFNPNTKGRLVEDASRVTQPQRV